MENKPSPYIFSEIRDRIDRIQSHFGLSGDTQLKRKASISGGIREYLEPIEGPPRKVKTLAEKLHIGLGVNPDWLLFGSGPMLAKDIQGRASESLRYEEIGRAVCNIIKMLAPELKEAISNELLASVGKTNPTTTNNSGLGGFTETKEIPKPKEMSEDEYARLLALRNNRFPLHRDID